jgi:hypothetical protein
MNNNNLNRLVIGGGATANGVVFGRYFLTPFGLAFILAAAAIQGVISAILLLIARKLQLGSPRGQSIGSNLGAFALWFVLQTLGNDAMLSPGSILVWGLAAFAINALAWNQLWTKRVSPPADQWTGPTIDREAVKPQPKPQPRPAVPPPPVAAFTPRPALIVPTTPLKPKVKLADIPRPKAPGAAPKSDWGQADSEIQKWMN